MMPFQRRQRGQIHHAKAKPLQHQAVFAVLGVQFFARHRRCNPRAEHRQIFEPQRQMAAHIAQQKRQAEKQHHHADFQQRIAAHKPCDKRVGFGFGFVVLPSGFRLATGLGFRVNRRLGGGCRFRLPKGRLGGRLRDRLRWGWGRVQRV